MTCYRPITGWKPDAGGQLTWHETKNSREIEIACGRCIGCRIDKQRDWSTRCQHEASCHLVNTFVTLTYEGEVSPSLNYEHFQAFMRKLRRSKGPARFFMCGEYGENGMRPHFHALIFGHTFANPQKIGDKLYRSSELEQLWTHGFSSMGELNQKTCNYVARYATKKITGPKALEHYQRVNLSTGEIIQLEPEFAHMSLKPGIGETWLRKNWKEVYAGRDAIITQGGKATRPPKYYDKKLKEWKTEIHEIKIYERQLKTRENTNNRTTARLKVREQVETARLKHNERNKL